MDGPGTRLHLRVSPGASASAIVGRQGERWKVRVASPPERGRANTAVIDLLAESLSVPKRQLELLSGHGARDKVVAIAGLSKAEAERRLEDAMGAGR